ncbi:3-deoxy-manno-octulosonate cytidylyltransferase [Psychrosphaera sp. B3R10]|uniref:3-deoxy-manno-octulosonate cytidylyltransferase n=1 Tax=unclassified Psychrosphaera TaxID=2641570 RepID=UPI001C097111|nr:MULTISPECIES: 3-deoxy-manno-octulosonate cytidylyltransferase [unclassified Psychrosphaera]MBU2881356.1 3-deoxy-manno-octulosonate cytidylyltransferase [Psychrosphaera sp. I2R16]MBU2988455.1 3-deoxy-manno-octulosonate cytidylyltransferase [Psychrosphaera sp. B3R10]MDO6720045.1 3-deoxy-manno-octulosonate cytidylyltransferase [Psychrosphaera sp. 1_MG-2023]
MSTKAKFVVVIPARYDSSRLPGKPLADIGGKPMVQWVHERAVASGADRIIVATDDERVKTVVEQFGGEVCLTRKDHDSGTERLAEVVEKYGFDEQTIVINVQGDEPMIPSVNISQLANNLAALDAELVKMATLAEPICSVAELNNPNVVKVVTDEQGLAMYFSRSAIPFDRDNTMAISDYPYLRHIGIYAYRAGFIKQYVSWQPTALEQIESLEQLRVLYHGEKIHVAPAVEPPPAGVDTAEDLEQVRRLVASLKAL